MICTAQHIVLGDKFQKNEKRKSRMYFVGNPEGKRPLGRTMNRWEDNIKRHFKESE
jgi:hypothetical protein